MANNVTIDGVVYATDDITGVHYQYNKLAFGPDDTATTVTATVGLPVAVVGTVAVTGNFYQATQPVSIAGTIGVTGPLTDTQLRATALPVSATSLPLPTGAATEATLAAISTKTPALGQTTMVGSTPVVFASNQSALPVTGSFWQTTQPVSGSITIANASLAVTGAFFQATQPVSIAGSVAVTGPLTDTQLRATTLPISGTVTANLPANSTVSGTLTANDILAGAPVGDGTLITVAPTANSFVAIPVGDGFVAWTLLVKAYTSGTIYTEASNNSTNGSDGDWVEVKGRRTGTAPGTESVVYAMVANGYYRGNGAGFKYLRARLVGGGAGATIRWDLSTAMGATFLNSGIPGGSSTIGTVLLGAGAAAIGSVTVTGTTAISAVSLPLPAGAATETTLAALNTKVTAVNTGAVTISSALPAGTNSIGTTVGPTLTKATQGATGYSTQDLKDAGRAIVNVSTATAGVTAVTTEAMLSLNVSRDGATTAVVTSIAVTGGKRFRITGVIASIRSTAATVLSGRVVLRLNPTGAAVATSPSVAIASMTQQAAALAEAGDTCVLTFAEAIEISGTMQVGLSQLCSGVGGVVYASLIGYEY